MSKRFVGFWIDDDTRKLFKATCIIHDITQQDVVELLLQKWLREPHVIDEVKELINGKKE
jgi:hypothetical protein